MKPSHLYYLNTSISKIKYPDVVSYPFENNTTLNHFNGKDTLEGLLFINHLMYLLVLL